MDFKDQTILITGGTGSFGNAVLNRFLDSSLRELRIFSRDEKKQDDLRKKYDDKRVRYYIGDIRDTDSVMQASLGADIIFHAAALKQVPSCEFHPLEAIKTNTLGTNNIVDASIQSSVKKLVFLSTDKAVYPINAMGMTKALGEKIAISKADIAAQRGTTVCVTRYGNVMASRGSVIPLFLKQIQDGAPITITDPNMTRFLMTLEESVDLVLHAFLSGKPGDTFVQKSPAATIGALAEVMIDMFKSKSRVKIIGTRHGEKLYETLVSREEMIRSEDHGRYFRIPADVRGLDYGKYFYEGQKDVSKIEDYTSHNTHRMSHDEIKNTLLKLDLIREQYEKV